MRAIGKPFSLNRPTSTLSMKLILRLLLLVWSGGLAAAITSDAAAGPAPGSKWELVWSDEFDHNGLPDPAKWSYEEGYVRNQEKQYYTRERLENARVENSMLVIEGRKEQFKNPRYRAGSTNYRTAKEYAEYTAASLITSRKASWLYGRIEVRAKLPQGLGVWPAIWMLGDNHTSVGWPRCGEIDIMEFVGHDPNHVHATVHYSLDGKHKSSGNKLETPAPYNDFHVYAVEWDKDRMDFYFDDKKYHTFELKLADENGRNPFRKPQFLMINLALGGSWGGKIDDAILPQKYLIDYVRVFKAKDGGQASSPAAR
jgi:beta-glucanase (GH16 family)